MGNNVPARAGLPPIKGFIETSFLDWRGFISAVLFLPGCNFACPYCHNYTLVKDPESYQTLDLEDVLTRLKPFVGWIDGVVVSGGEPTLHVRLGDLLEAIRSIGFKVKLDTNGSRPQVVRELCQAGLVDMVAMDLKAPLDSMTYARAAGRAVEVERVAATLEYLRTSGISHEIRSTIWPGWHGNEELVAMAQTVQGCQAWTLQALNPANAWKPEALGRGEPFSSDDLARLQIELADTACRAAGCAS
ncbi:MAG: anaerobic ribonucleoside-triphosphate reductase activating protein [Pseudomonadota bacterium]